MNHAFPVFLDLTGVSCLVIGEGLMVEEKTLALLAAGAAVTVQTPGLTSTLASLHKESTISWRSRQYSAGDLKGFFLCFATGLAGALNEQIRREAEQERVLFNAVDDPARCRFISPAVHQQGDLRIAISTNGKCPALAVRLKNRISGELGPQYGAFLELAGSLRGRVAAAIDDFEKRRGFWYRLLDSEVLPLLRAGEPHRARQIAETLLEEEAA